MAAMVKPILNILSTYTGFTCLTLVAGAPRPDDKDGYDFCAVHHGDTKDTVPKNFGTHDPEVFQTWSQTFCNFVRAAKGMFISASISPIQT